jgi:hypothetical protein
MMRCSASVKMRVGQSDGGAVLAPADSGTPFPSARLQAERIGFSTGRAQLRGG